MPLLQEESKWRPRGYSFGNFSTWWCENLLVQFTHSSQRPKELVANRCSFSRGISVALKGWEGETSPVSFCICAGFCFSIVFFFSKIIHTVERSGCRGQKRGFRSKLGQGKEILKPSISGNCGLTADCHCCVSRGKVLPPPTEAGCLSGHKSRSYFSPLHPDSAGPNTENCLLWKENNLAPSFLN